MPKEWDLWKFIMVSRKCVYIAVVKIDTRNEITQNKSRACELLLNEFTKKNIIIRRTCDIKKGKLFQAPKTWYSASLQTAIEDVEGLELRPR